MVPYKFLKLQPLSPCPTIRVSKTFPITGLIQHSFLFVFTPVSHWEDFELWLCPGVQLVARYSSTPTSKVLGKLFVSQLVIFPAFYRTRRSKIQLFCHATPCLEASSSDVSVDVAVQQLVLGLLDPVGEGPSSLRSVDS